MFDRPHRGERAVLVHLDLTGDESQEEQLEEFLLLVRSTGVEPAEVVTGARRIPEAKYFIGRGKADEVKEVLLATGADVVLIDHAISPSQERNLERLLECRVLDRTGLILDIFAQRARTHEGRLQVELAQLRHLSTRLIRGWTHLERQKGGIGLRGPGETQLETDRRLIGDRIKHLLRRLEKVRKQRDQGRRSRKKAEIPTVSLVGYTNAGKSTLFNAITNAEVYAADQLFATLDPTLRKHELPNGLPLILADTVGFIRHLPHDLVAAFRSTLEETLEATLLIHVIDAHSDNRQECIDQVNLVLEEIGASEVPQIEVYNKIDLMPDSVPRVDRDTEGKVRRVWLSAEKGEGLELLDEVLADYFKGDRVHCRLQLSPEFGRLRARLFEYESVLSEEMDSDGQWLLEIDMRRQDFNYLQSHEGLDEAMILPQSGEWLATIAEAP